jgi:hypothetical protein
MSNDTAKTITTNIVPVQGTFEPLPPYECINLIGPAGTPFFAPTNPNLDGVSITNSTINSSVIGGTTPAAGTFTNIATTTGTITSAPSGPNSIVNQAYVDAIAQGLSFKQPADYTTTGNITLSGLTTQAGGDWPSALTDGERILVKDQTTQSENGIYVAASGAWSRSSDANTWDELVAAYLFVISGTILSGSAWVNTNQAGGTLGVTAVTFVQFSNNALYTAGTGLTLNGFQFNIANTAVAAATYGSASAVPVIAINAQGQITSASNSNIAIAASQITSGTIDSARLSGSYSGITGVGTLTDLTVSNVITGSISGNAATATTATTATSATTATNIAGGAAASIPVQTSAGLTTFLPIGTNGQVLTIAGGVPSYATPTTGTVTSVSGTGTVSGISLSGTVTSSGSLTLGGTLDLSAPPTIGNTTPNTGRFTSLTVDDNSTFGTSNTDTVTFTARINSEFTPATDNTYDLGRTGHEWRDLFINGTANIDSLIADTADINAGTIDNTSIGATTAAAAKVTTLDISSTLALAGSTGTAGYVLTSNGASAPTWNPNANGVTIADDTTTNATRYITFSELTAGTETTLDVSSTKLQFNPSTGVLNATGFAGSGADLTNLDAGDISSGTLAVARGGTGITSFGTGVATWLGTPSSANLASAVTDETGTGSLVFATSPTLVTPILGTPQSGNLENCTFPTLNQNTTGTAANVTGVVAVANGGTGTATPSLVAGTNITITGSFPNQTIAATAGGGTVTSVAATVPSFLSVSGSPITTSGTLAISLSGTALPVDNGGTGATTLTANNVLLGNGTSAVQFVAPGSSGNVLTSNGTTWASAAPTGISTGKAIAMSLVFG